ncbi:MAG: hypothetical protein AB1646_06715 [Thermodesulfobacteriota bacterium]
MIDRAPPQWYTFLGGVAGRRHRPGIPVQLSALHLSESISSEEQVRDMRNAVKHQSAEPPLPRIRDVVEFANQLRTRYGLTEDHYRELLGMRILIWAEQTIEVRLTSSIAGWTQYLDRAMEQFLERAP